VRCVVELLSLAFLADYRRSSLVAGTAQSGAHIRCGTARASCWYSSRPGPSRRLPKTTPAERHLLLLARSGAWPLH